MLLSVATPCGGFTEETHAPNFHPSESPARRRPCRPSRTSGGSPAGLRLCFASGRHLGAAVGPTGAWGRSPEKSSHRKYAVLERLGKGGFAIVYAAQSVETGDRVAVKVLHSRMAADPIANARLEREAAIGRLLEHPNVRPVRDCGKLAGGSSYLVMDLLVGETLLERIRRRGCLGVRESIAMMNDVLLALAASHEQGIVHRDVSPANIFLTRDGGVMLLDFGMSHRLGSSAGGAQDASSRSRHMVGTIHYAAPEVVSAGREIDGRTDLFAVGAVLHYALTGARPFRGAGPGDVLKAILTTDSRRERASSARV